MRDIWQLADIEEIDFAAAASLLAIRGRQQASFASGQSNGEYNEDSADEEVKEKGATIKQTARLNQASQSALKDKFLDRLGEVQAREKSHVQQSKRMDSKHVAAAAWIDRNDNNPITVLVAKNEGLDNRDCIMSVRLQSWSRAIAATGRPPSIRTDVLWIGSETGEGLLEYSRTRLEYYITRINQLGEAMETLAGQAGVHAPVITCLQSLCKNLEWDSSIHQLSDIVNIAYQIRYISWNLPSNLKAPKALQTILMLGRLRAAYECFKTTALSFPEFESIEIKPVILPHYVEIDTTKFRRQLRDFVKAYGFSKGLLKAKTAQSYTGASRLHIHAEMQILVSLEDPTWQRRAHRYIGTSKKPCFLCNEFRQNYIKLSMNGSRSPAFKTRESHGKVYPLWTLPTVKAVAPNANLSIATAVIQIYHRILELLQEERGQQPAMAESSAGVTQSKALVSGNSKLKQRFGPKVKTVRVSRLPAHGKEPELVSIDFYALPEERDRRVRELGHYYMPDFHRYWGSCQLDRRFRSVDAENQEIKSLNGKYLIYWNENDELPENEHIKNLIGIKQVDYTRRFWYGDAFIVRYSEHPKTFAFDIYDVPTAILKWHLLNMIFQDMWEKSFLESELEQDQRMEADLEKREADKDIIFQRMTSVEREVLGRSPPNTLEVLALTSCDDGTLLDTSVEPCPNNPEMLLIGTLKRTTALESIGWTGFDSGQFPCMSFRTPY